MWDASQCARFRRVLVFFALGLSARASPGAGVWIDRSPLPSGRQEVGVAEVAGRIYVVGGFDSNTQSVNTVERYDPTSDQWEAVLPIPATNPINHVGAASVNGRLYVVGGLRQNFTGVNWVFCYDPDSNSWSNKADMPTERGAMGVAVIEGLIYAAGGYPTARGRDFAKYDPESDEWTVLPLMPTSRDHLAAASLEGKFHAISGRSGFALRSANEMFDPIAGMWSARAPIPTPRGGIAAAELGGEIYVFGGEGNPADPNGVFHQVEAYNPSTNAWRAETPMPFPRHGIGSAVFGGRIHIPGGGPVEGFGATAHHDSFCPAGCASAWRAR